MSYLETKCLRYVLLRTIGLRYVLLSLDTKWLRYVLLRDQDKVCLTQVALSETNDLGKIAPKSNYNKCSFFFLFFNNI